MTAEELSRLLEELMALPAEPEWLEFKEAKSSYGFDDLGRYFSALSNEANLKAQPAGWLVFGVTDKPPRRICGTNYRADRPGLDKVQKGRPLTQDEFRSLKSQKLVEGRRPNLFVSAEVAAATETKAEYIRKRAFDKAHFKEMVLAYLLEYGEVKREEIDRLLFDKVSDALSEEQKKQFVISLLQAMRRDGSIRLVGGKRGRGARWELCKPPAEASD